MIDYSDLIPLAAIFFIFGAPVTAWVISRVLAHRERMEMLRHGFVPPPNARDMRKAMKYGWTPDAGAPGAGAPGAGVPPTQYLYEPDFFAQQQLRKGIQVACIGFALLVGLGFIGYHDGRYVYGPWLLGGLIPMFVGIAQIIGAVLGGAQLGPGVARQHLGPTAAGSGPSTQASQAGSTMPPGPTYGGWRPGSTPEIEKPASPPDYRS